MVLALKQTHSSLKQIKPRNKLMYIWLIKLQQRRQEDTIEEGQSLQ